MTGYLTPEEIASRCKGARPTRSGFKAQCPAHDDPDPSLSIDVGDKATLVYCHAGCTVPEICEAIGVKPMMLFHDYGTNPRDNDAERELTDFLRRTRPPSLRELRPLRTLGDVLEEVITTTVETWVTVSIRWHDMMSRDFTDVMLTESRTVTDAIVADLIAEHVDQGYDYTTWEKRRLVRRLWSTYRTNEEAR